MPTELDNPTPEQPDSPTPAQKQYSDEEISKILATAKATRGERDEAAKRAKELETRITELSGQLETIKGIDPKKYKELEQLAQTYEERKLEEQRQFSKLKERWTGEKTSLQQEIEQLKQSLKQTQIVNTLEKSFYAIGGKTGKDEDGYSYFDLIRERATKYIQIRRTRQDHDN
jgi:DNA repair exonuclease SbcCD ATPase subunit